MNSTKESPLQFFYDFFLKGIYAHRNKFLNQDPNLSLADLEIIEINKKEEFIKTRIFVSGEWILSIEYYKNALSTLLSEQVKVSIGLIKSQVKEISRSGKSFYFYLDAVLGDLNEIRGIIKKSRFLTKYDSCIGSIYKITSFILETYPSHFKNIESQLIAESEEYNKIIEADINPSKAKTHKTKKRTMNKIIAFQWKDENPMNTLLLYECLKNNAIEPESGTSDKLKLAFSGKELKEPLKIKWIFNFRGQVK